MPKDAEQLKNQESVDLTGYNYSASGNLSANSAKRTLFNGSEEEERSNADRDWRIPEQKTARRKKVLMDKEKQTRISQSTLDKDSPSFGYFGKLGDDVEDSDTDDLELPKPGGATAAKNETGS